MDTIIILPFKWYIMVYYVVFLYVAGTLVTLACTDADSGVNGQMSYTMSALPSDGKFTVTSAGVLQITSKCS